MSLSHPRIVDELLNYRLNRLLASSGTRTTRVCAGRSGISRREWRLIALPAAHGGMSPSELAQRAHLERSRNSRLPTALAGRLLVRRRPVPEDGRRAEVEKSDRRHGAARRVRGR